MPWFFYAIAAPFCWALVNQADKFLVAKYGKTDSSGNGGLILFYSLFGLIAAGLIAIFAQDIFMTSFRDRGILIINGLISVTAIWLYLEALLSNEVSAVAPLWQTIPIFSFILGYVFLGETLSGLQIMASLAIIVGGFILSMTVRPLGRVAIKGRLIAYMLTSSFLFGLSNVTFKYVTVESSFWVSNFWEYIGMGVAGLLIFVFVRACRRQFLAMIRYDGTRILALNIGSEAVTMAASLSANFAIILAPIALVSSVTNSFQPVFVFLFSIIISTWAPRINKEDLSRRAILQKVIGIGILTAGSLALAVASPFI